jgi:hypothetical protein
MDCETCFGSLDYGSVKIGPFNTVLEQFEPRTEDIRPTWTLTTYHSATIAADRRDDKPHALQLTFRLDDNTGDMECKFFTRFEVQLTEAADFKALGSSVVVPYFFTREGREPGWVSVHRCFCDFPAEYRNEFYHMVEQLGEIRNLALFG